MMRNSRLRDSSRSDKDFATYAKYADDRGLRLRTHKEGPMTVYGFASGDLLSYAIGQRPGFNTGLMQEGIAEVLAAVDRGEIKRLIVQTPPQHGKTLLIGTLFSAWYLGRHQNHSLIYTTYNQERADDVGRSVRNAVREPFHNLCFNQKLSDDSDAAHRFSLTGASGSNASFFAVGRGGSITGRGANGIIIDDPIKDREEADSRVVNNNLRDFYSSVLYTRLSPKGWIILVMVRWQVDDLAGWLMQRYQKEGWVLLSLPAVAERNDPLSRKPGEALCPERYDAKALADIKAAILPRDWAAMYQQSPTVAEGDIFKAEWFEPRYQTLPERCKFYGFSDYAVTTGGDHTEHGVLAVTPDFNMYWVDWWSGQTTSDEWVAAQIDLARRYNVSRWFDEAGPIQKAVAPMQQWAMLRAGVRFRIDSLPSTQDKVTRAQGAVGWCALKRMFFPPTPWADEVIHQLVSFHEGATKDDKVDVVTLAGRALNKMRSMVNARKIEMAPKPFTIKWLTQEPGYHGKDLF